MGLYLNPNNRQFQREIDRRFYVDKTGIVPLMNRRLGTDEGFVCVSRPRRFGKSFDADMLVAYYTKGAESREQFQGLAASTDPSFETHLNKHDVIRIDVQRMIGRGGGIEHIVETIENEVLDELADAWPQHIPTRGGLNKALDLIAESKGSGFVFVIDEWDCVFREATHDKALQKNYLGFLRDLFKGAPYVELAYMTGILPIKKYGRHSALNLFKEFSVTSPKGMAPYVGFSAREVKQVCERFDMSFDEMRRWYDGYLIGLDRIHMYNPNSVAGAIAERMFCGYWTETETYEALQVYIDMDFDDLQHELVAMLDGQHVYADVSGFENDMTSIKSKDDVYALLVHLGYLGYDEVEQTVFIPNEEVRREFATSLRTGARPQLASLIRNSRELQARTLEGDEAYVAQSVANAHASAAGPHHYNDEQALRAAVKLAYIWSIDDYLRVDELPGGRGYADLVYLPKHGSPLPPLVVELKWNKPVNTALAQIKAKNYPASLAGIGGTCVLVGITYQPDTTEHACTIERIEL